MGNCCKHFPLHNKGNWSHRISRHSGMQAITSLPTYTSFPRYLPAKNYENQRKKARYAFCWYHPDFGRIPEGSEAELIAAGWPLRMVEDSGEALKGWVPRKEKSFQKLEKIDEGIYSHVYRAFDLEQNIKVNKLEPESISFMARDINILRRLHHPNIIKMEGLVASEISCNFYLVLEYMEH